MTRIINAVMNSSDWKSSAIFLTVVRENLTTNLHEAFNFSQTPRLRMILNPR